MAERKGRVLALVAPDIKGSTLLGYVRDYVMPKTMVFTDEYVTRVTPSRATTCPSAIGGATQISEALDGTSPHARGPSTRSVVYLAPWSGDARAYLSRLLAGLPSGFEG
jgi:hypothetical protein